MSATMNKPCTPSPEAGLSSPLPSETLQRAGDFMLERIDGVGIAAKLTINPGRGSWLVKAGACGYLVQEASGYRFVVAEAWVMTHHAGAARALKAIESIELGNNGHADIGHDERLANIVQSAGFMVLRTVDLHGRPTYKGFTAKGQAALRNQPYAASTYKAPKQNLESGDIEALILARQERHLGEA